MEAGEIDIGAIHDIDGARFRDQQVERVDIGEFAVRNMDKAWNITV